ncbi:MAG: PQQ-binding-like beta-propeller repeat protein [Candidatus Hydrogenedentes bacterium]|nr:PQQ-binding-like beta-propeller repeat protein [Candidatus Hydrogenedentota bacterium]
MQTLHGQIMGTLAYMPPEQAEGKIDKIDERSDVYALGAVLYELLAGSPPFQQGNPLQLRYQVIHEQPEPLASHIPEASPELIAICERAMAKNPDARYRTASELAEELERFQAGRMVQAYSYQFSDHLRRFIKKHKTILTIAAAATALLMVMATYSYVRVVKEKRTAVAAQQAALQELSFATISLAALKVAWGEYDDAAKTLARCPESMRNWEWGHLMCLAHPDIFSIDTGVEDVWRFEVSHDETILATRNSENGITFWDRSTGRELRRTPSGKEPVGPVLFTPDNAYLVGTTASGTATLWEVESASLVRTYGSPGMSCASISRDGKTMAVGFSNGQASIINLLTEEPLFQKTVDSGRVAKVRFFDQDRKLATVGEGDNTLRVWDCISGEPGIAFPLPTPPDSAGPHVDIAISPDDHHVVTSGRDPSLYIWDLATGALAKTATGHTKTVWSLVFSPDGKKLASTSLDMTVRVWDTSTWTEAFPPIHHPYHTGHAAFVDNGQTLITSGVSSKLRMWDITRSDSRDLASLSEQLGTVGAWTSIPGYFAGASLDKIHLVNPSPCKVERTIESPVGEVVNGAFDPTHDLLAIGGRGGEISLWDLKANREVRRLVHHQDSWVFGIKFSPDGRLLVTTGAAEGGPGPAWSAFCWDVETGELIREYEAGAFEPMVAALSPDGRYLVVGSRDNKVRKWDVATGELLCTLDAHIDWALCVAFSPDGKYFASGGRVSDHTVRLWDAESNALVREFIGLPDRIGSLAFSPDSSRLFAGDRRFTMVWDVQTGREVLRLPGTDPIALSPDGRTLIAAGGGQLNVWRSFSWNMEDYPGDKDAPFEERVELYKRAFWKNRNQ